MRMCILAAFSFLCSLSHVGAAEPVMIITPNEAQQPSSKKSQEPIYRSLTRGPTIEIVAPSASHPTKNPFRFALKFKKSNDVDIDLNSLRVIYEKADPIDITYRVSKFSTNAGIEIEFAAAPEGDHNIIIEVEDKAGRKASKRLNLKIAPE